MPLISPSFLLSRRRFLEHAVAFSGVLLLPSRVTFAADSRIQLGSDVRHAMRESPLLYLTPLRRNGEESKCHSEIWFAPSGDDFYVVTSAKAWRTRAIQQGLDRARVWVGDYGVWRNNDKFKSAPTYLAKASIVAKDSPDIERNLATMGEKYASEWGKWEPRFRAGLKDDSRVMLRYEPTGA